MTQHNNSNETHPTIASILKDGFEGMADMMKIKRNFALNDYSYKRPDERKGYANGFKNKTINTRIGEIHLDVPQVRDGINFYLSAIEKGLKTKRTMNLAIIEMSIQGVSTRKVEPILKELTAVSVSRQKAYSVAKDFHEELEKWRFRKLDWVKYMILDARYEKV